jgi:hypothetical protein
MGDKFLSSIPTESKQVMINNITQMLSELSGKMIGYKYGGYTGDGRPDEI